MKGIDTNVLVRYLAQDDEAQFCQVLQMLNRKREVFFVCDLVLVETDWVLRDLYGWSHGDVAEGFALLATIPNLVFEDEGRLRASLRALREGADLADELIVRISKSRDARSFATFDKGIIRRHKPFAVSV